jgi:hypothetical protein
MHQEQETQGKKHTTVTIVTIVTIAILISKTNTTKLVNNKQIYNTPIQPPISIDPTMAPTPFPLGTSPTMVPTK